MGKRRLGATLLVLLLLPACASLPRNPGRTESRAFDRPAETRLGKGLAPALERHPGQSGFYLLPSGLDAFVARALLAEAAESTLDVQYYIFHDDLTGKLLLDRILAAADRGVRVRILLDDMYSAGKDDVITAFSSHPSIEVRLFNPFAGRSRLSRLSDWLFDFSRVNRRMHNKMFVADGAAGIVGGRNVGNEYFAAREDYNFGDLDLLVAGGVVRELGAVFDAYWNSPHAFPAESFLREAPPPDALGKISRSLAAHREENRNSSYVERLRASDLVRRLQGGELPLVFGDARVVFDRPDKIAGAEPPTEESTWWGGLARHVGDVRSEVIFISPYFVPGPRGLERFRALRSEGVRVRILTNSLASNDVAVVSAGYAKYREAMLKAGVELYEIRPVLAVAESDLPEVKKRFGSSGAALHAKTLVFDRRTVFVGSANLDPRSVNLNTEHGIVVHSPDLARQVSEMFGRLTDPRASFRLALRKPPPGSRGADAGSPGELVWITQENGKEVVFDEEPYVGFWKRLSTGIQWFLAPESLL